MGGGVESGGVVLPVRLDAFTEAGEPMTGAIQTGKDVLPYYIGYLRPQLSR